MSDSTFRFRQFTVHQEKCAMKVGTDAVLIGSWVMPGDARRILDIGCGTGLIALMLAQKSLAEIDAVDIDEGACAQARENFQISPWFFRMNIFHQLFQDFSDQTKARYDLIVTNPPYFQHASKPTEESRHHARHNDLLGFKELIEGVKKILRPDGRFSLILPSKEGIEFLDLAQNEGLFCREMVKVKTMASKTEKRLMMQFGFGLQALHEWELVIQNEDHTYTEEYIELTKEYYIGLKPTPVQAP